MKSKYIHIGLPKNLSTTLQRDFFDSHPEIYHLGVGCGSNIDYINTEISSACENHFQYSKNFAYDRVKNNINKNFQQQFDLFKKNNSKKACGISLELLSFTFTPDQIEIEEKAKRVFDAFGRDTKIILIVRHQKKLIESLYKEAIKIGYYGTFKDYLDYIYYSRDKNFIFDFQYDYLYNLYTKYFGKENVQVLFIENYRTEKGDLIIKNGNCLLIDKLSEILKIKSLSFDLNHHNQPLGKKELENMRLLNKEFVHGIGKQAYSTGTNFHRLKDYFSSELEVLIKDEILYKDARVKNENIKKSIEKSSKPTEYSNIEFAYPEYIRKFLKDIFLQSNQNLQKLLNCDIPNSYFSF